MNRTRAAVRTGKVLLFFFILAVLVWGANTLLITNNRKYERADTRLADQSEVIIVGTSQAFNDINPQILWDEYGIPAYNYATAGQHVGITYYYLKDILKYQKPRLIMLDAECASRPADFLSESNKLYSIAEIRDPLLHHQMYRDFFEGNPVYEIPFLRYHNRWKEISRNDFQREHYILGAQMRRDSNNPFAEALSEWEPGQGGQPAGVLKIVEPGPDEPETVKVELGEREEDYLNRIADLAQEAGIPLVILDLPCYDTPDKAALSQATKRWAKSRGLPALMMNSQEILERLELSGSDFADEMHLNFYGAGKLSAFLGQWLTNEYGLGGHKGDAAYDGWESRMEDVRTLVNTERLMMAGDMEAYFEYLSRGRYTVALSLAGDWRDTSGRAERALAALGIQTEPGMGGAWVIENGGVIFAAGEAESYLFCRPIGREDLTVRGSGPDGDGAELLRGRENQTRVGDGINVLVFSNVTRTGLDAVGFDALNDYEMARR